MPRTVSLAKRAAAAGRLSSELGLQEGAAGRLHCLRASAWSLGAGTLACPTSLTCRVWHHKYKGVSPMQSEDSAAVFTTLQPGLEPV